MLDRAATTVGSCLDNTNYLSATTTSAVDMFAIVSSGFP